MSTSSKARKIGIAAVALLGGSLLTVPALSYARDEPAPKRPAFVAAPDRVKTFAGKGGKDAFVFKAGTGGTDTPYGFVSSGGELRTKRLGAGGNKALTAKTHAPRAKKFSAPAAAATYRTTITLTSANESAYFPLMGLWNTDTWTRVPVEDPYGTLSTSVSLPAGRYWVGALYGVYEANSYLLAKTFTVGSAAQTVTLAESAAKEVRIKTDDATAVRNTSAVWVGMPNGDQMGFAGGSGGRTFATPVSVAGMALRVHEIQLKSGASAQKPSPYRYDLTRYWSHPFPASPISNTPIASLPKQTITIKAQGNNTDGYYDTAPVLNEWEPALLPTQMRFPATFTDHVTPGVPIRRMVEWGNLEQMMFPAERTMRAGSTYPAETIGTAPLAPGAGSSKRDGSSLEILEDVTLVDAEGNRGGDDAFTYRSVLSSDGKGIAKTNSAGLTAEVPGESQSYRLEQVATRKTEYSQLSTQVRSDWTFASAAGDEELGLMDVGVTAAGLDARNRAGSAAVRLSVEPTTRTGAESKADQLEWSADDGRTWTELALTGGEASLTVPADVAYVSLRVSVSNDQGGALRRTVTRALAGPAVAGDEPGEISISNLQVNDGGAFVVGISGWIQTAATFTVTHPAGVAKAGLYLYHGGYATADGLVPGSPECTPVDDTRTDCVVWLTIYDVRWSMNSNALAGTWNAVVWAVAGDGSVTDRHAAVAVPFKRMTALAVADATPEPISAGRWLTVTGRLTRADWGTWVYAGFGSQSVPLQFNPKATTTWQGVRTVTSDSAGNLSGLAKASIDGSYRYIYAGDAISRDQVGAADYVDVQ